MHTQELNGLRSSFNYVEEVRQVCGQKSFGDDNSTKNKRLEEFLQAGVLKSLFTQDYVKQTVQEPFYDSQPVSV